MVVMVIWASEGNPGQVARNFITTRREEYTPRESAQQVLYTRSPR